MVNFDTFWDKKAFNLQKKSAKRHTTFNTYCSIYFAIFGSLDAYSFTKLSSKLQNPVL